MAQTHTHRSEYHGYPHLTADEFTETCHYLDRRYCRAALGPLRKLWRLGVHSSLDFSGEAAFVTFLQITTPLPDYAAEHDDLADRLEGFSLQDWGSPAEDALMAELEDSDKEALPKPKPPAWAAGHVTYEVHLHPTYRAPCLWFALHNLPSDEPTLDPETVFRRLVPDQFKDALRRGGAIGGLSVDHHPVTGVPAFFIHPCLLGDAMAEFNCSKADYLMVWLGLVGACVGLWVPKELAMAPGD